MRSHALDVFSAEALEALRVAEAIVRHLPDPGRGERLLRCHEVARVVASRLPDAVLVDGKCGMIEHSWLYQRDGRETRCILDPYTPARLPQVQLVCTGVGFGRDYVYGPLRRDIRYGVIERLLASLPEVL